MQITNELPGEEQLARLIEVNFNLLKIEGTASVVFDCWVLKEPHRCREPTVVPFCSSRMPSGTTCPALEEFIFGTVLSSAPQHGLINGADFNTRRITGLDSTSRVHFSCPEDESQ